MFFKKHMKETAYVDVSVATLWNEPKITRSIDKPSLTNPVNLRKWTQSMSLDEKLWLVGKVDTQALLGNKVTIIDQKDDWVKILVHDQPTPMDHKGYPGWVPKAQLTNSELYHSKKSDPFVLITKPTSMLYTTPLLTEEYMEISFNTRLPLIQEKDTYMVLLPNGNFMWLPLDAGKVYPRKEDIPRPTPEELVYSTKQFLGLPYLWGGISGFGFDCSGFTFSIYQAYGIQIPRDSGPQSRVGIPIRLNELQKGDLLFFAYENGKVHHVGIYVGEGKMIHSPESIKSIEITSIDTQKYIPCCARRFLP